MPQIKKMKPKMLSEQEELSLFKSLDNKNIEKIAQSYMPLVKKISYDIFKRLNYHHADNFDKNANFEVSPYKATIEIEDIISAGTEGLILAIKKYNAKYEKRFSAIAKYEIYNKAIEYFRNNIRPFNIGATSSYLLNLINKWQNENPDITKSEIRKKLMQAHKTKFSDRLFDDLYFIHKSHSVSCEIKNCLNFHETTSHEIDQKEQSQEVKKILDFLPENDKNIICMKYGIDCEEKTVEQISILLNKPVGYVYSRINSSIKKLKKKYKNAELIPI